MERIATRVMDRLDSLMDRVGHTGIEGAARKLPIVLNPYEHDSTISVRKGDNRFLQRL